MNINVQLALRKMGVEYNEREVNTKGWVTISAPYREDKNPSLGLNVNNGSFIDHGTGEKGSIIGLVIKTLGLNESDSHEFVYGKGKSKFKSIVNPESFWNNQKNVWLKECQKRLKDSPDSEIVEMTKSYDGLTHKTLINFECGLTNNYGKEWLVIPYKTGAQLYTRDNGSKTIRMEKGSKPRESFFGVKSLSNHKKLIIAKSPREAMLYQQELGESFDVISIASGEVANISNSQKLFLKNHLPKVNKVFISFDRDTKKAEDIGFSFARAVRDIDNNYGLDIELLNISKLTEDRHKDFTDLVKSVQKDRIGELFNENYEYSDYVWNTITEENQIWHTDEKGKVSISQVSLAKKLKIAGFGKIYYDGSSEPIMIRKVDNILSQPSNNQLNDFIRNNWIKKYSKIVDCVLTKKGYKYVYASEIENSYFNYDSKIMSPNYVAKLDILNVEFMKDTKEHGYLYFSDKVIKVGRDSAEEIPYSDIQGVIWETQINNRSVELSVSDKPDGVFAKFIRKVCAEDDKRIGSLQSHIGYLIHTYKNPAIGKAVILTDEKVSSFGAANGGTGKGVIAESIGHIRKKAYIDGKIFDYKSRFAYQDIKPGDQYLFIDDLKEDFEFSYFFPALTNDLTVEPKGQNRFTIPFEYSPKFVLSTNYPLGGNSDSYRRRQSIVEFAPYFSKNHTPEMEFGQLFFTDWDQKEWNKFDNLMIYCLQTYLRSGLITCSINYERKQLGLQTSPEFVEWAEKYIETNHEYDQRELFRGGSTLFNVAQSVKAPKNSKGKSFSSFSNLYPDILDINKQARTFNSWLTKFGEFRQWNISDRVTDGRKLILFRNK